MRISGAPSLRQEAICHVAHQQPSAWFRPLSKPQASPCQHSVVGCAAAQLLGAARRLYKLQPVSRAKPLAAWRRHSNGAESLPTPWQQEHSRLTWGLQAARPLLQPWLHGLPRCRPGAWHAAGGCERLVVCRCWHSGRQQRQPVLRALRRGSDIDVLLARPGLLRLRAARGVAGCLRNTQMREFTLRSSTCRDTACSCSRRLFAAGHSAPATLLPEVADKTCVRAKGRHDTTGPSMPAHGHPKRATSGQTRLLAWQEYAAGLASQVSCPLPQ